MFWLIILGIIIQFGLVSTEYCTNWDEGITVCHMTECCGNWPYQYCCTLSTSWVVGIAVGATVGGLVIIAIIVVLICFCYKKKSRVIYPEGVVYSQPYATTVAYTVPGPYYQHQQTAQYTGPQQPYPPSTDRNSNYQGSNLPEGLQSKPPAYAGLPGNHRIV